MENSVIHNKVNYILEKNTTWLSKSCKIKEHNGDDLLFLKQQKLLFSKINTSVYINQSEQDEISTIVPTNLIDLNHHFIVRSNEGEEFGKLEKKFITSKLWRTRYEFFDREGKLEFYILEENPWVRFSNMALKKYKQTSFIPKYFFKPVYQVFNKSENLIGLLEEKSGVFKSSRIIHLEKKLNQKNKNSILIALMIVAFLE